MNGMAWLRLVLLVAFAGLFNACQSPSARGYTPTGLLPSGQGFASPLPAPAQGQPQSPLAYTEPESLLVVDADSPDCVGVAGIDGYQMVRRTEIQPRPVDGSIEQYSLRPSISEMLTPLGLTPTNVGPIAVELLVAQSSVVGDEEMNGFATVHRRFTDRQALAEAIRWRLGGAPQDPLEVTTAQVDMWLTRDTHRLVRLRLQAEGKTLCLSRTGELHPFALTDEFNFTAVDRNAPIVVPREAWAAVEAQLKALKGE